MSVFLLTWDGRSESYEQYDAHVQVTAQGEPVTMEWRTGNRRAFELGDTVYLFRQKTDRGLIARGHVEDPLVRVRPAQSSEDATFAFVRVAWDRVLPTQQRIDISTLTATVPQHDWKHVYASGQHIALDAASRLERLWLSHLDQLDTVQADLPAPFAGEQTEPDSQDGRVSGPDVYQWLSQRHAGAQHVLDAYLSSIHAAFGQATDYHLVGTVEEDDERVVLIEVQRPPTDDEAWQHMLAAQSEVLELEEQLRAQSGLKDPLAIVRMVLAGDVDWQTLVAEIGDDK